VSLRTWVTAATCSARFSCRLPRGLSRCRWVGPLDAASFCADDLASGGCAVRRYGRRVRNRQSGTPWNARVPLAGSEQTG
jgi:hypothetical protein